MTKKQKRKQRQQRTRGYDVKGFHEVLPDRLCVVCERVMWGVSQPLGFGKERHVGCFPGSQAWREKYERTAKAARTEEMDIIYKQGAT